MTRPNDRDRAEFADRRVADYVAMHAEVTRLGRGDPYLTIRLPIQRKGDEVETVREHESIVCLQLDGVLRVSPSLARFGPDRWDEVRALDALSRANPDGFDILMYKGHPYVKVKDYLRVMPDALRIFREFADSIRETMRRRREAGATYYPVEDIDL